MKTMSNRTCRKGKDQSGRWIALGVGIAAGWAFLIGLYIGLVP
ncbi:hypothetical protein ElP_09870 [Tautonia plasticadhaerens]|uniref:Uncharacterized protein n=1 Tax=Tautonia plasticadhaerens TaxID=2527974 RepID=A0A518GX30_9BACT|nr:hypothetical protein ElP_09870 [Tautonia plasticadhaerens]